MALTCHAALFLARATAEAETVAAIGCTTLTASAETLHNTSSWSAPLFRPTRRNANPAPARPRRPPERAPTLPPSSDPWQTTRPPAAPRRQDRRCWVCTSRFKACGRTGGTVIRHSSRKHSRSCFTVAPRPATRRKPGSNRNLPAPQALFVSTPGNSRDGCNGEVTSKWAVPLAAGGPVTHEQSEPRWGEPA